MSDSEETLNAFLDSFKGDQEEDEFESDLDETLNALLDSYKGGQEEDVYEENSYLNQYFKFLSTHDSMKGAYMYESTLFTDAYVRKARNIQRPPPGNLEVHTNDEVEIFAGSWKYQSSLFI